MICPSCGFEVDDGLLSCPFCDADLTSTAQIHAAVADWCPSCGALLDPQDETCPICGAARKGRRLVAPAPEPTDSDTLLSSALPDEEERAKLLRRRSVPTARSVLAAVCGAIALVAVVLLLWHPWAPRNASSGDERLEPTQGSEPHVINTLAGQDFRESTVTRLGPQGSRTTYVWVYDAYEIMIGLAARLASNWTQLEYVADGSYAKSLDVGRDEASAILNELDILYADLAVIPEDGNQTARAGELLELVDLLRTSCRGVVEAWEAAMEAEAGERASAIESALERTGAQDAANRFIAAYQDWEISH